MRAWPTAWLLTIACGAPATPPPEVAIPVPPPSVGELFPAPPHQRDAWSVPETRLPDVMQTATAALFDQGLADPRGCVYRQIEIRAYDVWGRSELVRTHGWVIDEALSVDVNVGVDVNERRLRRDADRFVHVHDHVHEFAIAWNGLVYPIASAGAEANLRADVEAAIRRDEEERAHEARDNPGSTFYRYRMGHAERDAIAADVLSPIRAALLLRLGQSALAERVWDTWHVGMDADTNDDAAHLADPYLMLAIDWTWSLFDRAVNAHMQADDRLAQASAEMLPPIAAQVNRMARERGFTVDGGDYLPFLSELDALIADQRRRRNAGTPADRIAALDSVSARQMSQPGGVDLARDPAVIALVQEGDPAIEPLLAAFERDDRLTRAVSFHRDFARSRHLVRVYEAAYVALTELLGTEQFVGTWRELGERRSEVAAEMRRFHQAHRGQSEEDRWLAVLADDGASREQWIEAAEQIVGAREVDTTSGWGSGAQRFFPAPAAMPGEALRSRRGPSVTELLERRLAILNRNSGQVGDGIPYRIDILSSCRMARAIGSWDPRGGARTLSSEIARNERLFARFDALQDSFDAEYAGLCLAQHALALDRGGDTSAIAHYATWLRTASLEKLGTNLEHVFEPIWRHHAHPEVQRFLRFAFHDEASPFIPILRDGHCCRMVDLLGTRMVEVPLFRDRVIAELADRTEVAELTSISGGNIRIEGGGEWDIATSTDDPLPEGAHQPMRRGDVIAWYLTNPRAPADAPRVVLTHSAARRDREIEALVAYLRRLPPP